MAEIQRSAPEAFTDFARGSGAIEAHVAVTANAAVVVLSGHVEGSVEQHIAETRTERMTGVRAVTEEIEVRLRFDIRRSDEEIAAAALGRLTRDVSVPRDTVQVTVEHGWITLTGQVTSEIEKEAAAQDVHGLFGVVGVSDKITVKQPGKAGAGNARSFYRSWFFDPSTVTLSTEGETIRLVASREYYGFRGGLVS